MTYDSMFKGADLRTEEDGLRHEGAGRRLERRANLRLEKGLSEAWNSIFETWDAQFKVWEG